MNNSINLDINVNREQLDSTINKLELIKQILKEIKELDNNFSLCNVIEADSNTILVFNCNILLKIDDIDNLQRELKNKFKHQCIVLPNGITLKKAIKADYAKGRDYTTTTYYNENGNPIKEETTQYK